MSQPVTPASSTYPTVRLRGATRKRVPSRVAQRTQGRPFRRFATTWCEKRGLVSLVAIKMSFPSCPELFQVLFQQDVRIEH